MKKPAKALFMAALASLLAIPVYSYSELLAGLLVSGAIIVVARTGLQIISKKPS